MIQGETEDTVRDMQPTIKFALNLVCFGKICMVGAADSPLLVQECSDLGVVRTVPRASFLILS